MFSASRLSFICTLLCLFSSALAELFVISPQSGGTCAAGQSCTVRWMDDGQAPSLANMGACTVGLYHGAQQLVQKLDSVNVGSVTSFTFKPQANAGPNSASYYVAFTSASYKANGTAYISYSPNFSLTGMTGSFNSPVPSLTSSRPAPTTSVAAGSGSALPVSTLDHTVSVSISTNPSGLPKTPTPSMTTARISATVSVSAPASVAPSQSASARPSAAGSSASGGLRGVSVPFALVVVLPILVPIAFL